jgi:hypothetical protein
MYDMSDEMAMAFGSNSSSNKSNSSSSVSKDEKVEQM